MDKIKCPYCDFEFEEQYYQDYFEDCDAEVTIEIECEKCEKEFYTERMITFSYKNSKK